MKEILKLTIMTLLLCGSKAQLNTCIGGTHDSDTCCTPTTVKD
jgi:hypothetical protein